MTFVSTQTSLNPASPNSLAHLRYQAPPQVPPQVPPQAASQSAPMSSDQLTLRMAASHLVLLTEVLETYSTSNFPQMDILAGLRTDLVAAMNAYRIACQENAPIEAQLMQESDLLWHCNQCDYYLSQRRGAPLVAHTGDRSEWQLRQVLGAVVRFKLLTHVRKLMPGANTLSISWREILSGLRLWM